MYHWPQHHHWSTQFATGFNFLAASRIKLLPLEDCDDALADDCKDSTLLFVGESTTALLEALSLFGAAIEVSC